MTQRRTRGEGGITQRHDHPTCPLPVDGTRPEHRCRGRYQATLDVIVDGRRKRKTIYGRTKGEAQVKLALARKERDAGALVMQTMTVEAWMTRWLDRKARPPKPLKPQTMRSYRSKAARYIVPHLGRHRLTDLRAHHIEAMYDAMRADGLSEATLRQTHAILQGALKDAMRADHLSYNPIDKTNPPGTEKASRDQLTVPQARRVLAVAGEDARWWLALFYGMRQGEVLGLDWQHVDLKRGTLTIAQTLQTDEAGHLFLGEPKSARSKRLLPLLPQIELRLRMLWEAEGKPTSGLVFHNGGKPLQPKRDWQAWRDLLAAAAPTPLCPSCGAAAVTVSDGTATCSKCAWSWQRRAGDDVPVIALHAARNSAASLMEAAGIPDRLVMQILGQSQVATTHRYQTADVDRMRSALADAGRLLELP